MPLYGGGLLKLKWSIVELNSTMSITTGILCPTPIPWLPVLSNIAPRHIRCRICSQTGGKSTCQSRSPIEHGHLQSPQSMTYIAVSIVVQLPDWNLSAATLWCNEWSANDVWNDFLVARLTVQPLDLTCHIIFGLC